MKINVLMFGMIALLVTAFSVSRAEAMSLCNSVGTVADDARVDPLAECADNTTRIETQSEVRANNGPVTPLNPQTWLGKNFTVKNKSKLGAGVYAESSSGASSTVIDGSEIGGGTQIGHDSSICNAKIGENVIIGAHSNLCNVEIGNGLVVPGKLNIGNTQRIREQSWIDSRSAWRRINVLLDSNPVSIDRIDDLSEKDKGVASLLRDGSVMLSVVPCTPADENDCVSKGELELWFTDGAEETHSYEVIVHDHSNGLLPTKEKCKFTDSNGEELVDTHNLLLVNESALLWTGQGTVQLHCELKWEWESDD